MRVHDVEDAEDLPATPGAYALVIDLPKPIILSVAGKSVELEEGRYLYAGSARGPGGIRARVRRHLKAAKPVRWHVDRLTNLAGVTVVVALPGSGECGIVSFCLEQADGIVPAPGFGSTDCRNCAAHLVALTDNTDVEALAGEMAKQAGGTEAVTWHRPPAACFWRPPPKLPESA